VPLVARPPTLSRAEARRSFGLEPLEVVILLGFGGLGLESLPADRLAEWPRYTFLATEKDLDTRLPLPPNLRLLPVHQPNYNDLIAAADAVVGKPGFGMVSACLAQRVPFLYAEREDFAEYDVLVEAVERLGRGLLIPMAALLAGDLGPYLERLLAIDRPWATLRTDGDEVAARRLLAVLDGT
jgi:L-arabinokinase